MYRAGGRRKGGKSLHRTSSGKALWSNMHRIPMFWQNEAVRHDFYITAIEKIGSAAEKRLEFQWGKISKQKIASIEDCNNQQKK